MRTFICLILACGVSYAATPSRTVSDDKGSRIEFAIATVGVKAVFSQEEKDQAIENSPQAEVLDLPPPDEFEVAIATSGIKFKNNSDFVAMRDSKSYRDDKISDLPPSQSQKLQKHIDFIRNLESK